MLKKLGIMLSSLVLAVFISVISGGTARLAYAAVDELGNTDIDTEWNETFQPEALGDIIKSFPAPASYPSGATWMNGYLMNADFTNSIKIYHDKNKK